MRNNTTDSKVCRQCKVDKPLSAFHKKKQGRLGREARCKECLANRTHKPLTDGVKRCSSCKSLLSAKSFHKSRHRSDGLANQCKECAKHYKVDHIDVMRRREKEWRKTHPERQAEHVRKYESKHPDVRRGINNRRRAKLSNSPSNFTKTDVQLQLLSQNGRCWWCGKPTADKYHVDHRIALARGGSNASNNIVISCPSCNLKKKDKSPWEFNGRLL